MPQDLRQELLETQRDIPIPILVIPLEHIGHALQGDAALHKQIEAHVPVPALLIRAVEDADEGAAQAVPERDEGLGVLVEGDVAAAVLVEAVEEPAPGGEEGPQPAELVEVDRARLVDVEHADHHLHRVRFEVLVVVV